MSQTIFRDDIFKGKVAFVTGGGTGIGRHVVETLMRHGCDVTIVGRRQQVIEQAASDLSAKTGRRCLGLSADVRKLETLEQAARKTIEQFGKIDFVLANAAGNFLAPIAGLSSNAFKTVIEIDLIGTFNTIKATVDELKKTKGSFIATSATLHYKGLPLQAPASAAKSAIDTLITSAAVEYGPHGVRFNTIAPGPIAGTEGVDRLIPKEMVEETTRRIPLARFGELHDISNAAVYLFSEASAYVTGTALVVDGGEWHTGGTGNQWYPDMMFMDPKDIRGFISGKL